MISTAMKIFIYFEMFH